VVFYDIPLKKLDKPLITDWSSKEAELLISEINKNSHVKKAIFVYNLDKNFIIKYNSIIQAQKELKISR